MVSGGIALGSTSLLSAKASATGSTSITWLSLRPEYWLSPNHTFPSTAHTHKIRSSNRVCGIACIAFAIGTGGAGWFDRLTASQWFPGLEPQLGDIAQDGCAVTGHLLLEDDYLHDAIGISAMFKRAPWPVAPVAAIAVPQGSRPSDQLATLSLVSELRTRRDGHGCRMAVVVTVASTEGDDAFELELLKRGAFVLRAGSGTGDDHLHHFPLRASVDVRNGRFVCVDLADFLACWRPGNSAKLHLLSLTPDYGHSAVELLPRSDDATFALNIDIHWDPHAVDNQLVELDRLGTHCYEHFLAGEDCYFLLTTSDRLHGETGTVDVVVITRKEAVDL